jgi:hypothetical protein
MINTIDPEATLRRVPPPIAYYAVFDSSAVTATQADTITLALPLAGVTTLT